MESGSEAAGVTGRPGAVGVDRYALALEAGRMGTWYWDVASGRVDWDEPMLRVFGIEPGGFDGTFDAYLARLHPDDVEPTMAVVQESLATGSDHYVEHRIVLDDGTVRWVSGTGRPILGPDGEVVGLVGVGADISEQRAAHEATLAAEAATVIARDAAARMQSRLALLGRVSGVLGGSLDVSTTLQQSADLVVQEGLADWCTVEIPGGPWGVSRLALAHRDPEMVALARRVQEEYPPQVRDDQGIGKVLATGEPELWPQIPVEALRASARDEAHWQLLESLELTAAMLVPLPARGRTLGVMTLIGTQGRSFDEEDLATAVELGRRAGIALDNAYLYDDRDQVARTLQQSLLPPALPDVPGVDLAAAYRPGSIALGIGGDFYDVFPAGEDRWRLVIGDVCGKGVSAAALTGAVRYALRTAAVLTQSGAEALRIVNDTLLREDWHGRFATLALLGLEVHDGTVRLTLASGGHPPPLLRRADGSVERLEAPGTLVGMLTEAEFEEVSVELSRGDCLLLYTDGLLEAGAPGDMFGEERLHDAFASASGTAEEVTESVVGAHDAFVAGGRVRGVDAVRDDLAVLTLVVR